MKSALEVFFKSLTASKYRPLILFVVKAVGIFLLVLLLKFIHQILIDPSSTLGISVWLRQLDLYALMADTMLYPSQWILNLFGYETIIGDRTIHIVGCIGIIVHGPCMGINLFGALIAFVIAYPSNASLLRKTIFIIVGILALHLLNVIRVSALLLNDIYKVELPMEHHDLYNLVIYGFVLLIFYYWINYNSKLPANR